MNSGYNNSDRKYSILIFNFISLSMLGYGLYSSFCSVYSYPKHTYVNISIVVMSLVLCIIWGLSSIYTNILAGMSGIVFAAVIMIKYRVIEEEGNSIISYIQRRDSVFHKKEIVQILKINIAKKSLLHGQLAMILIMFVILSFIAAGVIRLKSRLLMMAAVSVVVGLEMYHGKTPDILSGIFIISGILGLFYSVQLRADSKGRCISRNKSTLQNSLSGNTVSRNIAFVSIIFVCLIVGMGASYYSGENILSHSSEMMQFQHNAEEKAKDAASMIAGRLSGIGTEGYMTNLAPSYTGKKVMEVVFDASQKPNGNIYLKGFTGDKFTGSRWENFSDNKDSEFDDYYQSYEYEDSEIYMFYYDKPDKKSIMYMPYWSGYRYMKSLDRNSSLSTEDFDSKTGHVRRNANVFKVPTGLWMTEDWLMETDEEEQPYYFFDNGVGNERSYLCKNKTTGIKRLQNYRDFVYDNYFSVPDYERLKKFADSIPTKSDFVDQCRAIKDKLYGTVDYSLDLKGVPFGDNYFEYFLFGQHKGYCEHFATAATILMREKGIPARYASGYCISPKDFVLREINNEYLNGKYYVAEVRDLDAHAWTEVYEKNMWLPVDMTKGSGETPASEWADSRKTKNYPDNNLTTTSTAKPTVKPTAGSSIKNTAKPAVAGDKNRGSKKLTDTGIIGRMISKISAKNMKILIIILYVALIFILCGLTIYAVSVVIYMRYKKDIAKCTSMNERVTTQAYYFMKVLKYFGLKGIEEADDDEFIEKIKERFASDIDNEVIVQYKDILSKAAFSASDVSEAEEKICESVMKKTIGNAWSMGGIFRRGIIYVLGLRKLIREVYYV